MEDYESKDITINDPEDILHGEIVSVASESTYERVQREIEDNPDVAIWDEEIFHYIPDNVYEKSEEEINAYLIKELSDSLECGGSRF